MKTIYPSKPKKSFTDWLIYINNAVNKKEPSRKIGSYYIKNRKVWKAYNTWLQEKALNDCFGNVVFDSNFNIK